MRDISDVSGQIDELLTLQNELLIEGVTEIVLSLHKFRLRAFEHIAGNFFRY